jgi:hypothetical protein
MRRLWIAMLLSVASCSAPAPEGERESERSAVAGPNVGVSQAAGVSLSYFYGFRLPAERIIAVQEEHAALCEALDAARCRVTGMSYDIGRNRAITASLQLKLAPDIARKFGKQGIDITVKRGGMLASALIESEDSGSVVATASSDAAAIEAEKAQLTEQLSKAGLSSNERTELQRRLVELSEQQRTVRAAGDAATLKLASTPMSFRYTSGNVDAGLTDGAVVGAIKDGWANVVVGFATILTILISVSPWIATAILLLWLWRWGAAYVRRWFIRADE